MTRPIGAGLSSWTGPATLFAPMKSGSAPFLVYVFPVGASSLAVPLTRSLIASKLALTRARSHDNRLFAGAWRTRDGWMGFALERVTP